MTQALTVIGIFAIAGILYQDHKTLSGLVALGGLIYFFKVFKDIVDEIRSRLNQ